MIVFFVIELNMSTIHYTSEQEADEIERILDRAWGEFAVNAYQVDGEENWIFVQVGYKENIEQVKEKIIADLDERDLNEYRVKVTEGK